MKGSGSRAREALRGHDFRRLFAIRLVSQSADGLFLAALTASTVFDTSGKQTATGFFINTVIVSLPFSVLGPFVGVFIDRWSRRRIMLIGPLLKAAPVALVLFDPESAAVPFFAGALWVVSVNRFFLATAQAVVPRLVPTEDLLVANSIATVGGTVALLAGAFTGGQVSERFGNVPVVVACAVMWVVTSLIAGRIRSSLTPHQPPEPAALRHEVQRVVWEFRDGFGHLIATPRAIGPITSITLDQVAQGIVLVLSLVVFRERFKEGVGSFSYLLGAGGIGVLIGIVTVGSLEERFRKELITAGSFVIGGVVLLLVSLHISGFTILVASFAVGLTFAWKKVPVDTMVQEAIPDAYRGRVFAVYDVFYNLSRVFAAALAIPMIPLLGVPWSVALTGLILVLWAPVLPRWVARAPELVIRFYEGARSQEWPRSVVWGGVEEPVEVRRSWRDDRDGLLLVCFRLALTDGTVIDVSRPEPAGEWRLDRELPAGIDRIDPSA